MNQLIIFIFCLAKGYDVLNIFQQAHYHIKPYIKHYLLNIVYTIIFPIICFSLCFSFNIPWPFYFIVLFYETLYCYFLFFSPKKHMRFTKRMIGPVIAYIIVCVPIFIIPKWFLLPYCAIEFFFVAALKLNCFIYDKINQKYIYMAKEKLHYFRGRIIGITGSAGKTSTKWIVAQVLKSFYRVGTPNASYNTPLGIAKFINETDLNVDFLVLEYGISNPCDMDKLLEIVEPDIAILTEILPMHMEEMKSLENVLLEKGKLLDAARVKIVNFDNEFIKECYDGSNVLSYGIKNGMYQAQSVDYSTNSFEAFSTLFKTNLVGRQQILNCMACLTVCHYLNLDMNAVRKSLTMVENYSHRLSITGEKHKIIDDSYNSNILGFKMALEVLKEQSGCRILLTPGIVELGKYEKAVYEDLTQAIVSSVDEVILIGRNCNRLKYCLKKYAIKVYMVYSFKQGFSLAKSITQDHEHSCILIENDLPDLYKIGFRI